MPEQKSDDEKCPENKALLDEAQTLSDLLNRLAAVGDSITVLEEDCGVDIFETKRYRMFDGLVQPRRELWLLMNSHITDAKLEMYAENIRHNIEVVNRYLPFVEAYLAKLEANKEVLKSGGLPAYIAKIWLAIWFEFEETWPTIDIGMFHMFNE